MIKYLFYGLLISICALPLAAQPIDRSRPPKPGPAPVLKIKDPETFTLSNGIKVLVAENHKAPKIQVSYTIDRSPVAEGNKAGLLALLGAMLMEGTIMKSKVRFDEETDIIGADIRIGTNGGYASSLTKYFDKAVELLSDALRNPALPGESLEKNRQQLVQSLKANEKNTSDIAGRVEKALNFGKAHPYGEFATESTYNNITLEDVKDAYKKYFTPDRGYLVFVGDITPDEARRISNTYFAGWTGSKLEMLAPAARGPGPHAEIDVIDVPNAVQTVITVTHPIDYRKSGKDYFALMVANEILGGGSQSRLFKNLREKHGYTYGAYSVVEPDRFGCGSFSASASVRNEVADSAAQELINELQKIRAGKISKRDLRDVKNSLTGKFALSLEDPARVGEFALDIETEKLPPDFYRTYLQRVNAVTAGDVQKAATKYFRVDNARLIFTGKASEFRSNLKRLGYPINEFNKYAEPL